MEGRVSGGDAQVSVVEVFGVVSQSFRSCPYLVLVVVVVGGGDDSGDAGGGGTRGKGGGVKW